MTDRPEYRKGFADQPDEIDISNLPVEGRIPDWLVGSLIRNGPAKWRIGQRRVNHWFDGLAMLHRFGIDGNSVSYQNKYLRTKDFRAAEEGTIGYDSFATDPCRSWFRRHTAKFSSDFSANANVNISRVANEYIAMTETPIHVAFDERTLDTIGVIDYHDSVAEGATTAHPHYDPQTGETFNYVLEFGRHSTYTVYSLARGATVRKVVGSHSVEHPAYMHSFALTSRFVVLMEFPFVVNPLGMLLSGKPFIENYRWRPELGTTFTLFDRATGEVQSIVCDEPWFGFHHVNAFDRGDELVVDVSVYPNASIVSDLSLNQLIGSDDSDDAPEHALPPFETRRFTIDLTKRTASSAALTDQPLELPRINYGTRNQHEYQYAYGVSIDPANPAGFLDRIAKVDVTSGSSTVWYAEHTYPGEPVFVPRPGAEAEDDGVLLSVVLDATTGSSFLLVLAASDLSELARADVPQAVPFGFHGQFLKSAPA